MNNLTLASKTKGIEAIQKPVAPQQRPWEEITLS